MAFFRPFIRAQMNFSLPDGEVAAITWGLETLTVNTGMSNTFAGVLEARAATFWGAIDQLYNSGTKYTGVKAALYNVDGETVQTVEQAVTAVPGSGAGANLPTEVAICCTFLTALADRSSRGRFYLPAPSTSQVTATGRLDTSAQTTIAGAVSDLLDPLVDGQLAYSSVVVSRTKQKTQGITQVRVGNVFDVQRRRRDSHAEVNVTSIVQ